MSGAGIQLPPILLFFGRSNIRVSRLPRSTSSISAGSRNEQVGTPRLVDHRALVQVVEKPARLGIQTNVAHPALVVDPRDRLNPGCRVVRPRGRGYGGMHALPRLLSACPTGALVDNPERPQVSFVEDACVQCGLCKNTCPESVIRLEPRLNFTDEARQPVLIKQEEPFECARGGRRGACQGQIRPGAGERLAATAPIAARPPPSGASR
jgi:hypothetical protein